MGMGAAASIEAENRKELAETKDLSAISRFDRSGCFQSRIKSTASIDAEFRRILRETKHLSKKSRIDRCGHADQADQGRSAAGQGPAPPGFLFLSVRIKPNRHPYGNRATAKTTSAGN